VSLTQLAIERSAALGLRRISAFGPWGVSLAQLNQYALLISLIRGDSGVMLLLELKPEAKRSQREEVN